MATPINNPTPQDSPYEQITDRIVRPSQPVDGLTTDNVASQRGNAQDQPGISQQQATFDQTDWRVKLRLAPGSQYLYNSPDAGILSPIAQAGAVIFPYTPQLTTNYTANYSNYDLTHSNYRGYFYQNSFISEVSITGTFTAQDTEEANYLLAVIHFFKSVTKMFYGQQDAYRGAPPPLVYLDAYGEYQFNNSPCVLQNFNYSLPPDVDYIKAFPSSSVQTVNAITDRITGAGLAPRTQRIVSTRPTMVPTKMDITITLLPVQTRQQVSQVWNMKDYGSGNLVKRGYW